MGLKFSDLYSAPEVNPINRKARAIPFFNPINVYGRVFFFSWFGFMIAFWAWYTFPPLLTYTIKADLHLSPAQVANSNIVSLLATLLVRLVAGPLCDQFGSRKVFGGLLLIGSIPLGLAPLVQNASGLYVSRFFIGILGGSFVPCQVWSTGFFDKNVVGTANALTGGFGNAGGGITYFIMPAVYDSFVSRGHTPGQAWRLTFIVPLIMVIFTGLALLLLCPDTPTGPWSERHLHVHENLVVHGIAADDDLETVVTLPGAITDKPPPLLPSSASDEEKGPTKPPLSPKLSPRDPPAETLLAARSEVVVAPTLREALHVAASPQTAFHVLTYMNSFGGELAINAILASYYASRFPGLGQTGAANWAAMFGFLNFITRPMGGVVSDLVYKMSGGSLWWKKGWIVLCGVVTGVLLLVIGRLDPRSEGLMFGLVALMAVFLEAGNGANFSLVPHVHPFANGILSGLTGAGGNLGGVIFAIIFRFMDHGTNYAKGFWVMGVIHIAVSLGVSWIPPLPKGQIGGH
ncbi:major facilitator superfamily domain-containing protein [Lasiosphaeria hispida]|uniref:Nitrate/nitrite transporter n=1 Tax=Lasiosphaeria hispida TaxID=260671 RepID=A0AAJ0M8D1_9PEZI|nr:major facilitator superfamily domain-containing protein [Lasiosphaeria hispida]